MEQYTPGYAPAGVDRQAEALSERSHGLDRAFASATGLGSLGQDVANVEASRSTEDLLVPQYINLLQALRANEATDVDEALRPLLSLSTEPIGAIIGFLAVSNEVDKVGVARAGLSGS